MLPDSPIRVIWLINLSCGFLCDGAALFCGLDNSPNCLRVISSAASESGRALT